MTILTEAARSRSLAVRAPADRPSERRSLSVASSLATVRASATFEVRDVAEGDGFLDFDGYASVTGTGYEMWDAFGPYMEQVTPGAFAASLARADLDVPFVLGHDSLRRLARTTNGTLTLAEDDHGLRVLARMDAADQDVAYIAPKLRSGLIDEMSFRFRIDSGTWSPDWTAYAIDVADIHRGDVAIVGYGANPATAGSGLRAATKPLAVVTIGADELQPRTARR